MGIQGLLPFVEKSSKKVNISEYSGCTVAIDSYCWLHKGAFACAEKLARGEDTDQYVVYCMRFVNMLLSYNIKPILVFDGQHLPAKADTEKVRRERREANRKKAAELLRSDRPDEAKSLIRRCVDVTHEMALALMKKCRAQNVDCIVAPFEADAQLAYLNISNIAHIVITEDSDLLLFGCKMVLFKMDVQGNGILVEQSMLPLAMKQRPEQFSIDKFRYMCILAGCDYLPSLPGIGLVKACKFIKRTSDDDIKRALTRMGGHLNMPHLVVTPEYRDKFMEADGMFRHQPVFDPIQRRIVPLTPLPPGVPDPLPCSLSRQTALQLAYGNLDPFTLEVLDTWDPDLPQENLQSGKNWNVGRASHKSIWTKQYELPKPLPPKKDPRDIKRPTTQGKQCVQSVTTLTSKMTTLTKRMSIEEELETMKTMYGVMSPPSKRVCTELEESDIEDNMIIEASPIVRSERNPFRKSVKTSPVKAGQGGLTKLSRRTILDENNVVQSRYFGEAATPQSEKKEEISKSEVESKIEVNKSLQELTNFKATTPPPESKEEEMLSPIQAIPKITPTSARRNIFSVKTKQKETTIQEFTSNKPKKHSFLSLIDSISGISANDKSSVSKTSVSSFKWSKSETSVGSLRHENDTEKSSLIREKEESYPLTPPLSQENPVIKTPSQVKKPSPKLKKTIIQPAKRVGLNKKKSGTPARDSKQTSLLTMFAFQPKAKLKLQ